MCDFLSGFGFLTLVFLAAYTIFRVIRYFGDVNNDRRVVELRIQQIIGNRPSGFIAFHNVNLSTLEERINKLEAKCKCSKR